MDTCSFLRLQNFSDCEFRERERERARGRERVRGGKKTKSDMGWTELVFAIRARLGFV
jgi:hypothetical protein